MGACLSSDSSMSDDEARRVAEEQERSKAIESENRKAAAEDAKQIKLLFLGAGESGKSTLFRQMQILYGAGFSEDMRKKQVPDLHLNAVESMKTLLDQASQRQIKISDELSEAVKSISAIEVVPPPALTPALASHIAALWRDAGVRATYDQRSQFQLADSSSYLFDRIIDLAKPDYIPSIDDYLRVRVRTTGVYTAPLKMKGRDFQVIDVGGQRSERKKWFHQFSSVTAVIFVAAISEFDQVMYEDEKMNRMEESMELFNTTINNKDLSNPAFILFLNKCDLFEQKIAFQNAKIGSHFEEYPEEKEGNVDFAKEFIASKYKAMDRRTSRQQLYVHFTTAIATNQMQQIFDNTREIIINNSLVASGIAM